MVNKNIPTIDSRTLVCLLKNKHSTDVFVTECKNGQSFGRGMLRLDAWAMKKSWSPLTTIGYEIKVDRNDFERDNKWTGYLPYVHEFYFVCPPGLIKIHDLPPGIGLMWSTMNGQKLITKMKSHRNTPDLTKQIQLLYYVIMARSVIVSDMHAASQGVKGLEQLDKYTIVNNYINEAKKRNELAVIVKGHIREEYGNMLERVKNAKMIEQTADQFAERLQLLGINWDPKNKLWVHTHDINGQIDALHKGVSERLLVDMERLANHLLNTVNEIKISKNILGVGNGE